MAFLFSSTVALWRRQMFYGLFVKAASPLSPVSSLFPSPRGVVRVRLFPSRPLDCCMFYKQRLRNACVSIDAEHSVEGFYHSVSLLFLIFHLKRQITSSHPILAATMSAHLHKMPTPPSCPLQGDTPTVEWRRIALSEHWIGFPFIILRLDS